MSLYTISSVLVLDSEGKRICCKYFTNEFATSKDQLAFEKNLFQKTHRANAEILMWDNVVAVYRNNADVFLLHYWRVQRNGINPCEYSKCSLGCYCQTVKESSR